MSGYQIRIDPRGWTVERADLQLNATGAIHDRGTIRATISVRRAGELIHRDNVSLTGERARGRFVQRCGTLGVQVDEAMLLALDEVIRSVPKPSSSNGHGPLNDGDADIAETVRTLADVREVVARWLLLNDNDVLDIVLGAVVAHRLGGESPWLVIVAPPSGTKTEILRALDRVPDIYFLSELTARTFASGLDTHGQGDPSLLARLRDELLVLKDFTTVLEMNSEERQSVLAQLREIYDGRYDKAWGTGKELHWEGRLGFLAGVTSVIDRHHAVMGLLGPRFLQIRLRQPNRQEMGRRAIENASHELEMRRSLSGAVAAFLRGVPLAAPRVGRDLIRVVAAIADVTTRARSPVERDRYRREIEHVPEPESPARLARQLHALLQGITLVRGREEATNDDIRLVARVARDCIPAVRWTVIQTLCDASPDFAETPWKTTTAIAQAAQQASETVRRALEELQVLGLVACEKGGPGHADAWSIPLAARCTLAALTAPETFSAMSEGASYGTDLEEAADYWAVAASGRDQDAQIPF